MTKTFTRINQGFDALSFETQQSAQDILDRFASNDVDYSTVEDFLAKAKIGAVLQGVRYAIVRNQ